MHVYNYAHVQEYRYTLMHIYFVLASQFHYIYVLEGIKAVALSQLYQLIAMFCCFRN